MKVTFQLTQFETENLLYALGNSTNHEDVMLSLFPNKRERKAAYLAEKKIKRASYLAHIQHSLS